MKIIVMCTYLIMLWYAPIWLQILGTAVLISDAWNDRYKIKSAWKAED